MDSSRRRRTRDKSAKSQWSEQMSPEAKIAMQLAIEDTKALKLEEEEKLKREANSNGQQKSPTRVAFADEQNGVKNGVGGDSKNNNTDETKPSFTELFDRNGSARMRRDITDDHYSEDSESKKALGGGKVESAMEIIEIVNHDEPVDSSALDEKAIEELARINSVDKCTVWIEATQAHQTDQDDTKSPSSDAVPQTVPETTPETIPEKAESEENKDT